MIPMIVHNDIQSVFIESLSDNKVISVEFNTSKLGKLIYSGLGFVEQHYCITSHILLEILRQITLFGIPGLLISCWKNYFMGLQY